MAIATGTALAIGVGAAVVGSAVGAHSAGKAGREAQAKEDDARIEMDRLREVYANLDTSNPFANMQNQFAGLQNQYGSLTNRYAGMENTMEDLTINQKQAQFERDQFQQSQANIMGNLRGAAGGSGIAALAQTLARQGQVASQQASASIGQQEATNTRLRAQEGARLQTAEASGAANVDQLRAQGQASVDTQKAQGAAAVDTQKAQGQQWSQEMEFQKQGTLLGMSQQEVAAYMEQGAAADQAKWDAISGGVDSVTNMAGSYLGAGG